jgi:hypothetical protein
MSKEMREQINKVKNFGKLLNEKSGNNEIDILLKENGFNIKNIYDEENVKGIISSMKLNNVIPNYLYEAVDFELDNPGGTIIFSTDLNSTLGNAETVSDKVKFFFDSKWKTFLNRLNVNKRLKKILLSKYELPCYTVGKNFRGSYTSKNGITFNEKSFTVDIAGVDSDALKLIATEICREFKQETVMVRDFNDNKTKVYFVNDEKI